MEKKLRLPYCIVLYVDFGIVFYYISTSLLYCIIFIVLYFDFHIVLYYISIVLY